MLHGDAGRPRRCCWREWPPAAPAWAVWRSSRGLGEAGSQDGLEPATQRLTAACFTD